MPAVAVSVGSLLRLPEDHGLIVRETVDDQNGLVGVQERRRLRGGIAPVVWRGRKEGQARDRGALRNRRVGNRVVGVPGRQRGGSLHRPAVCEDIAAHVLPDFVVELGEVRRLDGLLGGRPGVRGGRGGGGDADEHEASLDPSREEPQPEAKSAANRRQPPNSVAVALARPTRDANGVLGWGQSAIMPIPQRNRRATGQRPGRLRHWRSLRALDQGTNVAIVPPHKGHPTRYQYHVQNFMGFVELALCRRPFEAVMRMRSSCQARGPISAEWEDIGGRGDCGTVSGPHGPRTPAREQPWLTIRIARARSSRCCRSERRASGDLPVVKSPCKSARRS